MLTQEKNAGGLGLGTIPISVVCLLGIVVGVVYLSRQEKTAGVGRISVKN
jgi:uncharacterized membrane-anchored protein